MKWWKNQANNKKVIDLLYRVVLGRSPDPGDAKFWNSQIEQKPLEDVFWAFLASEEFRKNCQKSPIFNQIIYLIHAPKNEANVLVKEGRDKIDCLNLVGLKDNWEKFEQIILDKQKEAKGNTDIANFLSFAYLNEDRNEAFNRFLNSYAFYYIKHVLRILGLKESHQIVEIGGGSGHLIWALYKSSFKKTDIFDPNHCFVTGTGYLKSRNDTSKIKIFNSDYEWYNNPKRYDAVITCNCIHHFRNISFVAACIRQKLKPLGRWYTLKEWFADSAYELATIMKELPLAQENDLYEWPYPAITYVDAMHMAGFELKEIIPAYYADDVIGEYKENPLTENALRFTNEVDKLLESSPGETVKKFWSEHYALRAGAAIQPQYTRPQVMVFEKKAII